MKYAKQLLIGSILVALSGCTQPQPRPQIIETVIAVRTNGCTITKIDIKAGPDLYSSSCPEDLQWKQGKQTNTMLHSATLDAQKQLEDAQAKVSALNKLTPDERKSLGLEK